MYYNSLFKYKIAGRRTLKIIILAGIRIQDPHYHFSKPTVAKRRSFEVNILLDHRFGVPAVLQHLGSIEPLWKAQISLAH